MEPTSQFFSINLSLLPLQRKLPIDLYINASVKGKIKFVRVFPKDDQLTENFREQLQKKYAQFYVPESQRQDYFLLLGEYKKVEEVRLVKEMAVDHLQKVFESANAQELTQQLKHSPQVVQQMGDALADKSIEELKIMIGQLSFHDFYTFDHSINVCLYSLCFYRMIYPKASKEKLMTMGVGALLHDIGKLKVATGIINKPGSLSDEEFASIQKHPEEGVQMISPLIKQLDQKINWQEVLKVISQHHENIDGTGYPAKIQGEDIHHMAKVCAFADIFDALTTKRSYNEVVSFEKALEILASLQNKKLDKKMFESIMRGMGKGLAQVHKKFEIDHKFDPSVPYRKLEIKEKASRTIKETAHKVIKTH